MIPLPNIIDAYASVRADKSFLPNNCDSILPGSTPLLLISVDSFDSAEPSINSITKTRRETRPGSGRGPSTGDGRGLFAGEWATAAAILCAD